MHGGPPVALGAEELGHRGVARLLDALAPQHSEDRAPQDAQVEQQRAVLDVPDVVLEALLPARGVAAVDLRPAGHPGPDLVAAGLPRRVAR